MVNKWVKMMESLAVGLVDKSIFNREGSFNAKAAKTVRKSWVKFVGFFLDFMHVDLIGGGGLLI